MDPHDETYFSIKDLWTICKRHRRQILLTAAFSAAVVFYLAATKPIQYKTEATFRENGTESSSSGANLQSLLSGGPKSESASQAITIFTSKQLAQKTIEQLHLQATVQEKKKSLPILGSLQSALQIERAHYKHLSYPVFPDRQEAIAINDVVYTGEIPLTVQLTFEDDIHFLVHNEGTFHPGLLGEKLHLGSLHMTLLANGQKPLKGHTFVIIVHPIAKLAAAYAKTVVAEADKKDSRLIKLSFRHSSRTIAQNYLNSLIDNYLNETLQENKRVTSKQIGYLEEREANMLQKLEAMMHEHATIISEDLSTSGFVDSKQEMEYYAKQRHEIANKVFQIELNLERLQKAKFDPHLTELIATTDESHIIYSWLNKIQEMKQQADNIELALRDDPFKKVEWISQELVDLRALEKCCQEAVELLESVDSGAPLPDAPTLFSNPRFILVKTWHDKVSQEPDGDMRDHFSAFLNNLIHQLHVHKKLVKERISHNQSPSSEFESLTYKSSEELYSHFIKALQALQTEQKEIEFALKQMERPEFEITALSAVIKDPISANIISKTSELSIGIKDHHNRLQSERSRLQEGIDLQTIFLRAHLEQSSQILQLREEMLLNKLTSLKTAILMLLRQDIALYKKYLADFLDTKIYQLKQEEQFLEGRKQQLQQEMAKLPQKWTSEMLITHHLDLNTQMLKELYRLSESKSLTLNLDAVRSHVVDAPEPPLHPESPRLLLLTSLGGVVGLFAASAFFTIRSVTVGMPATKENLQLANLPVIGTLTSHFPSDLKAPLLDSDLSVLRKITAFFPTEKREILFIDHGTDYSHALAALYSLQGNKTIIMRLIFDRNSEHPGLLQALKGEEPVIIHHDTYDELPAGGADRFGKDAIFTDAFEKLLQSLNYDRIIAITDAATDSGEAQQLCRLFDCACFTVKGHTLEQMKAVGRLIDKKIYLLEEL